MNEPQEDAAVPPTTLVRIVALPLISRILTDTGFQILFPFMNIWARELGVSTLQMGRLIGFRNLTGLLAPFWGTLADRYGYRRFLQLEAVLIALGQLLFAYGVYFPLQLTGLMLSGMATFGFLPTLQAYISTRLPYTVRARGMGIMEYAWALAGIIGVLATGWIIERINWQAPFLILSLGLLAISVLYRSLPGRIPSSNRIRVGVAVSWVRSLRQWLIEAGIGSGSVRTTMLVGALISYGLMSIVFVFGNWLTTEYDTSARDLGIVAMFMGIADLGGTILVTLFTDRLGKKRAVLGGSIACCGTLLLLPLLNVSLTSSVVGLMLVRWVHEFTLVSFFTFASEQVPQRRGALLSLTSAFIFTGGSLAGFTGPWLYQQVGIVGPCVAAAVGMALVALLNVLFLREPQGDEPL